MPRIIILQIIFLLLNFSINVNAQNQNILDVDFMQSMTDGSKKAKELLTADPKYSHYLQILQENYDAKKPSKMPYSDTPLIPKVMHQVWIGSSDIPPLYQHYLDECKELHPDWEFKIWGDKEVAELGMEYQDLYDKSRLYPGKTDIIRFEVLNRFGGVYRDMDIKCYRSIDDLNHQYELYTSLEYPGTWKRPAINTGLLAAKARHPMLKSMLDNIRKNIDQKLEDFDNGVDSYSTENIHILGVDLFMLPFTDVFVDGAALDDKNIAFPATYFLPISYNLYEQNRIAKILHKWSKVPVQMYFQFIKPESLMWHNIAKNEIVNVPFDSGNGIKDPSRRRLYKILPPSEKRVYGVFKDLYSTNNTEKISNWSKVSKVPQEINFIVFNDDEIEILEKHKPDWVMLNRDFNIKVWDKQKIVAEFPELNRFLQLEPSEEFRFYLGLKILEKFGGTYANFRAIPYMSIFELNNKYNFYAGLMPINKSTTKVLLSKKLIGASKNNPIISKTIASIDLQNLDSLKSISSVFTKQAYENIYLNGKNIVLPAIHFEPIDKLDDDYWYTIPDYIIRFFTGVPKSFNEVCGYSVVE